MNWILYAEGITLGTIETVFVIPSSDDIQALNDLRLLDQIFSQSTEDPSYISYSAGGLLRWTQAKPLPDNISLLISTMSPEWKGLTTLLTSLLRDPPDRRVTLPETCTFSTGDLPVPNANSVTRFFLPLAIQDIVTAAILDYENLTAALAALFSDAWMQPKDAGWQRRGVSPAPGPRTLLPLGASSTAEDIEPFLADFEFSRRYEHGRITRHAPLLCMLAACCCDSAEVGRMARGLAAVVSVLRGLAMDQHLDEEEDDDCILELCRTIGAQLRGLRGVVIQF